MGLLQVQAEKALTKLTESVQLKAIAGIHHHDGYLYRKRGIDKTYPGIYWEDEWGSAY